MKDICFDCHHELDSMDVDKGHNYYGGACHTRVVEIPCKCKKTMYKNCPHQCTCTTAARGCSYSGCEDKAVEQYRDQYTSEENPYLCQTHDGLRQFIES